MTSYNEYINPRDKEIIKRILTCEIYLEISIECKVSFSTVNNLINGRVKVMKHNYHVYIRLMNEVMLQIEMFNLIYKPKVKQVLK